ncbi:MAG: hypothetical protein FJY86_03220 [Candidatus Diapherotrites archaeon]|uniref:CARDB domain-containing protein n=1 Tax=Candidatus Iainarchaeum sp. TaxID=3101447 RepID=A0A8T4C7Z1_9ARCH|nr:hypothetical protein [Candidatus Diapherotrites archaeon]
MNVFKLLVTAVLAGTAIYFITGLMAPLFVPQTNLSKSVDELLLEAQAQLGENSSKEINTYPDQTLNARNYDNITRNVAFTCAGSECCPFLENCTQNVGATPEIIRFFKNGKTTLSARCEKSESELHTCNVYVGKIPAQLKFMNVDAPVGTFQAGETITFNMVLFNTGEVDTTAVTARIQVWEKQFENGKEVEKISYENENNLGSISARKTTSTSLSAIPSNQGSYRIIIRASAENAGYVEDEYLLNVGGEIISTCAVDNDTPFEKKYDSFENVCREKRYCTGCGFAFECRNAWESVSTIPQGWYFDTQRGESTFTYILSPTTNGEC